MNKNQEEYVVCCGGIRPLPVEPPKEDEEKDEEVSD